MEANFSEIGIRIKNARKKAGYSQMELAEKAEISLSHLSNIENGKKDFGIEIFAKIVNVLNCSSDSLLGHGVDDKASQYEQQLYDILEGSTDKEKEVILDCIHCLKQTFMKAKR